MGTVSKGVLVTQIISIESDTVEGDLRTLVLKRPRLGETYDFPNIAGSVNVLTGYGAEGSEFATATYMGGHSASATNAPILTFSSVECDDTDGNAMSSLSIVVVSIIAIIFLG